MANIGHSSGVAATIAPQVAKRPATAPGDDRDWADVLTATVGGVFMRL